MNKLLAATLRLTLVLFFPACVSAPVLREPISMRSYPADAYAESNLLVVDQVRMALPQGWRFMAKEEKDPKDILFLIKDTGSNTVAGHLRYAGFDQPVAVSGVVQYYANEGMNKFSDRQIAKTEIDGKEAYVVQGTWENGAQRSSALIQVGTQGIMDITLFTDPGYLTREPSTVYTIFNSFEIMPKRLSERRIKGMFSFKCEDAIMQWVTDNDIAWGVKGFRVSGNVAGEYLGIDINEVKTSSFEDLLKLERMTIKEFATQVQLAGQSFPAKAIGREEKEKQYVMMYFLFKHGGKNYYMHLYRPTGKLKVADIQTLHQEPEIRRALDTYFYFDS